MNPKNKRRESCVMKLTEIHSGFHEIVMHAFTATLVVNSQMSSIINYATNVAVVPDFYFLTKNKKNEREKK